MEKIGLTKREAKFYFYLLKLGETKTGKLSKYSKIPTSNMYPMLEVLLKKGIISSKFENNVKVYYPNHPENLKALFSEKEEELEKSENKT